MKMHCIEPKILYSYLISDLLYTTWSTFADPVKNLDEIFAVDSFSLLLKVLSYL